MSLRNVTVDWANRELPGDQRTTKVLLEDGYSTEADIPKIIAIAYLDGARDADKVIIDDVYED